MRSKAAFTLMELLAVLAIVLVVVAGSIGVWLAMAGTVAPGRATAVVQAMLVGAREYAVSNGVMTRVVFKNSLDNIENGTTMYLQKYDSEESDWVKIVGRGPQYAGRQVFVLTGAPDLSSVTVPSVPADAADLKASDVKLWQKYRDDMSKELAQHAFTNVDTDTGYLKANAAFKTGQPGQAEFYVTFDATGTLALNLEPEEANPTLLTIVQVPGAGRRVGEHQFYVLNVNTGTQLVFE